MTRPRQLAASISSQALRPGGFLKVEPPVRALTGLALAARAGDLVHLGDERRRIAGDAGECRWVKMMSWATPLWRR